jgi:hypothetical protein
MKNNILHSPFLDHSNEKAIRDYAYHLYEQSNRIPGRDLENWMEAKACLAAHIPASASHMRLQHFMASHENGTIQKEAHPEGEHARSALHPLDWLRSSLHHT